LLSDPGRASKMGKAGRQRVVETFGWPGIATRTVDLYNSLR
jgi:starch synthase